MFDALHDKVLDDLRWICTRDDLVVAVGVERALEPFLPLQTELSFGEASLSQMAEKLSSHPKKRMGRYFEQMFAVLLKEQNMFAILGDSIIIKDPKRVIGEADALCWDRTLRKFLHVEAACKFFLYIGHLTDDASSLPRNNEFRRQDLKRFVGLDKFDSFWKKLHHLKTKQLQLFQSQRGKNHLLKAVQQLLSGHAAATSKLTAKEVRGIQLQTQHFSKSTYPIHQIVEARAYFHGRIFLPSKLTRQRLEANGFYFKSFLKEQTLFASQHLGYWVSQEDLQDSERNMRDIFGSEFSSSKLGEVEFSALGANDLLTGSGSKFISHSDFLKFCNQAYDTFRRKGVFFKIKEAGHQALFGVAVVESWITEPTEQA